MSQITIRDLPESMENELRRQAAERRVSLSRMVAIFMQKALGLEPESVKKRDVSCLFGQWDREETAEFDNNTAIFRKIDDEIWK